MIVGNGHASPMWWLPNSGDPTRPTASVVAFARRAGSPAESSAFSDLVVSKDIRPRLHKMPPLQRKALSRGRLHIVRAINA